MSRIKTFVSSIGVALVIAAPLHAAQPLYQIFADCAGRLSAEIEHAWLLNLSQADQLEARRSVFLSLLDATLPPDDAPQAMSHRIEAKMAQFALLTAATFDASEQRAARAKDRARWHIARCDELLLDS